MIKVVKFVQDSYDELKRVQWPSKQQTYRLTAYVIGVSLGVGIFLSGTDYVLTEAINLLLGI